MDDSKGFVLGVSQKLRIYGSFHVFAAWKVKTIGAVLAAAEVTPKWERWKSFLCCLFLFLWRMEPNQPKPSLKSWLVVTVGLLC